MWRAPPGNKRVYSFGAAACSGSALRGTAQTRPDGCDCPSVHLLICAHRTRYRRFVPWTQMEVNDIDKFVNAAVFYSSTLRHFSRDHRHSQARIGPRRTVDFRNRRRRSRVRRPRLGRGALWLVAGRNTNMAGPPWAYPRVVYGHQSTSPAVDRRRRATTGQLLRSCSQRSTLDCSALFYRCLA